MEERRFHKDFKLNGKTFKNTRELLNYSENNLEAINLFLVDWFNSNDFIIVKTSGSTGNPKDIKLLKKFMINSAIATGEFFDLIEKTSALLCMSVEYIAGKMMLVRALTLGWHLDVVPPNTNPLQNINHTYDFSAMVPLQVKNSLKNLHKVKKLIIGGGVVSDDLVQELRTIKTECFATYGMTETITHIAVKKLNNWHSETEQGVYSNERHSKLVSKAHYSVLPNVKISQDKRNCLVILAPKVSEDLVITNDVVKIISESEFEWLGRFDNIINSGGIKLIPEQIETKLSEIITQRFFVFGKNDEVLGSKLVLIIEAEENENILKKVLSLETLSKYEKPKEVFFLEKFIETATQKIDRKKTFDLIEI